MSKYWTTAKLTEWESALRSGEYPMGFFALVTQRHANMLISADKAYCCLGVACEVLGLDSETTNDGVTPGYVKYTAYFSNDDTLGRGSWSALPEPAYLPFGGGSTGWLTWDLDGLDTVYAQHDEEAIPVALSACNDSREFTQDQIADLVHWFFVVPSIKNGPRFAYKAAVAVDAHDSALRAASKGC